MNEHHYVRNFIVILAGLAVIAFVGVWMTNGPGKDATQATIDSLTSQAVALKKKLSDTTDLVALNREVANLKAEIAAKNATPSVSKPAMPTPQVSVAPPVSAPALAPVEAFVQQGEDETYLPTEDDSPTFSSNNLCQSGQMTDGIGVNCNNAFGADQGRVSQRQTVMVWQLCPSGWALVPVSKGE